MAKISELKAVVEGMTKSRWIFDDGQLIIEIPKGHSATEECFDAEIWSWNSYPAQYFCDCGKSDSDKDGEAIVALRNHAESLIELVEAVDNCNKMSIENLGLCKEIDGGDVIVDGKAWVRLLEAYAKIIEVK